MEAGLSYVRLSAAFLRHEVSSINVHSALRWEYALRVSLGFILPLCIAFTGMIGKRFVMAALVPILYQVFIVLTPPTFGGALLPVALTLPLTLMAIGFVTIALEAIINTWDEEAREARMLPGFLVLLGFWLFTLPAWKITNSPVGSPAIQSVIMGSGFLFVTMAGLASTGIIFGLDTSAIAEKEEALRRAAAAHCNSTTPESPIAAIVDRALCYASTFEPNVTLPLCFPWVVIENEVTKMVEMANEAAVMLHRPPLITGLDIITDGIPTNASLCVSKPTRFPQATEHILMVSLSPGPWILSLLWEGGIGNKDMIGLIFQLLVAMVIAACCASLARLFPPARLSESELRNGLASACDGLQATLKSAAHTTARSQPDICELDVLSNAVKKEALMTLAEPQLRDPGCTAWPGFLKLISPLEKTVSALSYAALLRDASGLSEAEAAKLAPLEETLDALLGATRLAFSWQPLTHFAKRNESAALREEITRRLRELGEAKGRIQQDRSRGRGLFRSCSVAYDEVADGAVELGQAADALVALQCNASCVGSLKGFGLLVAGLVLPALAPLAELLKFWVLLPKNVAQAHWCGRIAWWRDHRIHAFIRCFVVYAGTYAVVVFVPEVRNWLAVPIGAAPDGKLGEWLLLPVVLVCLNTFDATWGKGLLRVCGTLLGAAFGYLGGWCGEEESLYLEAFIFLICNFLCTFIAVDDSGALGSYGAMNQRYGYAFALTTYTACIIGIDMRDNTMYTLGEFVTIRVVGQLCGIAVCLVASVLLIPRFAYPTVCSICAGGLDQVSALLLAPAAAKRKKILGEVSELHERLGTVIPEAGFLFGSGQQGDAMPAVVRLTREVELCARRLAPLDAPLATSVPRSPAMEACAQLLEWAASRCAQASVRFRACAAITSDLCGVDAFSKRVATDQGELTGRPSALVKAEQLVLQLTTASAQSPSAKLDAAAVADVDVEMGALQALIFAVSQALPMLTNTTGTMYGTFEK